MNELEADYEKALERQRGRGGWEVRSNYPECTERYVERGTKDAGNWERAVTIHHGGLEGYGVACLIEAALNMRDWTVE